MPPKQVIIVTDGDLSAQLAVERAAFELGLYFLQVTGGNPTRLSGPEVVQHILRAPHDPVVVMADDKGRRGLGPGEMVVDHILKCPEVAILGVVAVASDTRVRGVVVDFSVTADGRLVKGPVDKNGWEEQLDHHRLEGDTIEIFRHHPELLVLGCGDLGKMGGRDAVEHGAMITRKCFEEILLRSKPLQDNTIMKNQGR
ncbi:MAG: stage V sporulation protein AE [Syntrophomonas sp.]